MSYSLDVRKISEDQYDGSTGTKIETTTSYQLGAVIDGQFVPFVTKAGPYVDALVARGKENAPAAPATEPTPAPTEPAAPTGDGGGTA